MRCSTIFRGLRSVRGALLCVFFASFLPSFFAVPPLAADGNPNGWIRPQNWNLLLPIHHDRGCSGGGEDALRESWLAPYEIGLEDPRPGDVWDIDFGGASPASGWGGIWPDIDAPTWLSYESFPTVLLPAGDTVDLRLLCEELDRQLRAPSLPPLPVERVFAVATTYVENTTDAPIQVEICTSSDDSIQVWLNNRLVTNASACRGVIDGCSETRLALLQPGVSKIAVLVWNGWGGWGFRLGLRHAYWGEPLRDDDGYGVTFHGTGVSAGLVGEPAYDLERRAYDSGNCASDEYTVVLDGTPDGPLPPDALRWVFEEVASSRPAAVHISDVSHGGTVLPFFSYGAVQPEAVFLNSWLLLGPFSQRGGAAPGVDAMRLDYLTDGVRDEATIAPSDGETILTDYDGAAASAGLVAGRDINTGGVPTWTQWHDPDDTIDFNDYYGGAPADIDGVVMYAVAHLDVFETVTVQLVMASDDSIQVLLDGVEVHINSVARGCGLPGEIFDTSAPVALSAGRHRLLVKVFDGGGNHCFRLGLRDATTGGPVVPNVVVCTNPEAARATCNEAGQYLQWTVERRDIDDGLSYTVQADIATETRHRGFAGYVQFPDSVITRGDETLRFDRAPVSLPGLLGTARDIGAPPTPGSTSFDGSRYTMVASGADIWNDGDQIQFAYTEITGDFSIEARIARRLEPPSGSRWGRHGLMARWSCEPDAKFSMLQTNIASPGEEIDHPRHSMRLWHGLAAPTIDTHFVDDGIFADRQPEWMRLVRIDRTIFSFLADDTGRPPEWKLVGSDAAVDMPERLLVGMALTSHAGFQTASLTFDEVRVEALGAPDVQDGCTPSAPAIAVSFSAPEGGDPAGAIVVARTGPRPYVTGGRLRLAAEGGTGASSAVWFRAPDAALEESGFVASFDVFASHSALGASPDANPADGMTFVALDAGADPLAPFPAGLDLATLCGDVGGNLGYAGAELGLRTEGHGSFAVEVDLWANIDDTIREPPGPASPLDDGGWHIGLDLDGRVASAYTNVDARVPTSELPDLFAAAGVRVEVRYQPEVVGRQALVGVSVAPGDGSAPPRQVIDARIHRLGGELVVGFTAGTGDATATLEVDDFELRPLVCCASSDLAVSIAGPSSIERGEVARLRAVVEGLPPELAPQYAWRVESGTGVIVGVAGDSADVVCEGGLVVSVEVTTPCSSGRAERALECVVVPSGMRLPGDCNLDGSIDISDALCLLGALFLSDPLELPCTEGEPSLFDWNGDARLDTSDAVRALHRLFLGGPPHVLGRSCVAVRGCLDSPTCP